MTHTGIALSGGGSTTFWGTATTGEATGPQEEHSASSPPETLTEMPLHIFLLAVTSWRF